MSEAKTTSRIKSEMRLICPNCDAQYEVPDDVIPPGGRDVQCSNCQTTWFFQAVDPMEAEAIQAEEEASVAPPSPPPAQEPAPETQPQRRQLDPGVADVLREEAEFERRARASEQESLETQPDLGLDDIERHDEATRRASEARARMARMRGQPPNAPTHEPAMPEGAHDESSDTSSLAAAAAAETTRRGLLPDIEEINSTLRSDEDRSRPQETEAPHREAPPSKRGGFRRGFVSIVVIAALGVAGYLFAPQISAQVPPAEPYLAQYVEQVDGARGWLDGQVLGLLAQLDTLVAGAPESSSPVIEQPEN
ncbi:zinc-ribbon domain-containing protein [Roseobacteraceae bacterium S113]